MVRSILVLSGKGGTGKTLVTINIGKALMENGSTVSLLDLDLDSPNLAEFLKIESGEVLDKTGERISFKPIEKGGMKVFSMGAIIGDLPVSMKGDRYAQIIRDVLSDDVWKTDYYVCDLPSGVSDEWKEAVKVLADGLLGSIIVVQPSNEGDARRMLELHKMEGLPVIGLIENMSYFKCSKCEERYEIFGNGTAERLAGEYGVAYFGAIPLSMEVKEGINKGQPYLKGYMKRAINTAVKAVNDTAPITKGLIQRIRSGIKSFSKDVLLDLLAVSIRIVNETIEIDSLIKEHGFPGGRNIELNITDKELKLVKSKNCFRVEGNMLKYVPNPRVTDMQIYIWDQSFIWSCLGHMKTNDETLEYSWKHALLTGKVEVYGAPTQEVLEFVDALWSKVPEKLQQNTKFWNLLSRMA